MRKSITHICMHAHRATALSAMPISTSNLSSQFLLKRSGPVPGVVLECGQILQPCPLKQLLESGGLCICTIFHHDSFVLGTQ